MFHTSYPNWGPEARAAFSFGPSAGAVAGLYGFSVANDYTKHVVQWNGAIWKSIGAVGAADGIGIYPMATYREAQRDYLVLAGVFEQISGVQAHDMARWDGVNWSRMGTPPSVPFAMCVFDDGSGPSLHIGFDSTSPNAGVASGGIARWTGAGWVSVGGGVRLQSFGYGGVRALCVFDDGTGPALFAAGTFDTAGAVPARQIAKWDGSTWSALGWGISGFPNQMVVANDGRGESLFVGTDIFYAGGGTVYDIAQWVGCRGGQCYANCDNSTTPPRLNAADFMCFLNAVARKDPYANCDISTGAPYFSVSDFICFMNKFAEGCP
jgi:hypothetical protein